MRPSDILDAAADKITPPGSWTQQCSARTETGFPCLPNSPEAACWCATGAIYAQLQRRNFFHPALIYLAAVIPMDGLVAWNDAKGRTQAEVIRALRDAAGLARSEGC